MPKYKFWNVHVMLFMDDYWYSFSIIPYWDKTFLFIDLNLQKVHFAISLVIISGIDKDLIKYLIERRDICDLFILEAVSVEW